MPTVSSSARMAWAILQGRAGFLLLGQEEAHVQRCIAVVGSLNVDLVVRVPRFPVTGETLTGATFATFGGGKGANQATAAARLGGAVRLLGQVGEDAHAYWLLAALLEDC